MPTPDDQALWDADDKAILRDFLETHRRATLVYDTNSKRLLRAEYRRNPIEHPDWNEFRAAHEDCDGFYSHDQVAVYELMSHRRKLYQREVHRDA